MSSAQAGTLVSRTERVEEETSRSPEEKGPASPPPRRGWLGGYLLYLVVQCSQLGVLYLLAPRFFWLDDSQAQFGPMAWWLGKNQRGGRPPLMDPDLGLAGNVTADMQYGVLDPLHWGLQFLASRTDNFILMSWTYGVLCILLLGSGSYWLLKHYGVRSVLAVAGAVGIASSGFFMWYGGSWWPVMWSTAWLPWLWVGLATRRWPGVIAAGVATWAILTSGNPYAVPFALVIVAGQTWEIRREYGSVRRMLNVRFLSRVASCVGGVVLALPTLLTAIQLAPTMLRPKVETDPVFGNNGFAIPNLADVVLGGPTLMGQSNFYDGHIGRTPAMATLLIALPLLALVNWRKAARHPGVVTAFFLFAASILATQIPTTVAVFRYPMRYLVIVQLALPLLALIAVTAAPQIDRSRLRVAAVLVVAQVLLSILRAPFFVGYHLLGLFLTAAATAAAIALFRAGRGRIALSSVVLVAVAAGLLLGEQMMVGLQRRVNELDDVRSSQALPYRAHFPAYEMGTSAEGFRARSWATDRYLSVIAWGGFEDDRGWASGIVSGNANLLAGLKPGFGSLAVWHKRLNEHWCNDYLGATCDAEGLLERAEGTSKVWLDLVTSEEVLMEKSVPPEINNYFSDGWTTIAEDDQWAHLHQERGLPGRITDAQGVEVSGTDWFSGAAYLGRPFERYVVSTGASRGSLIFRIPYWPGLTATLDGRPIEAGALDGSLLKIDLPSGLSDAELSVAYEPVGARILNAATGGGLAIILLSALALGLLTRRRTAEADASDRRDRSA